MVVVFFASITIFILLARQALGYQVTPNSPCASACLEIATQNPSDPNDSNTLGSQIVCQDVSFSDTVAGKKLKSCVSCLQRSTAHESESENDQAWFLYNIRYVLGSCLYGFAGVSDSHYVPCSTEPSCRALQDAIEDGNFVPKNQTAYSYCSADKNAVLSTDSSLCIECLHNAGTEVFLSNFLVALQAGCVQQPVVGTLIGLDDTVFSKTPVKITDPGFSPADENENKKASLSKGTIIGIAVGLGILMVITIAIMFFCYRKRQELKMIALQSPLDARFGAPNITSPNAGAYGDPKRSQIVGSPRKHDSTNFSAKELIVLDRAPIPKAKVSGTLEQKGWRDADAHLTLQPSLRIPSEFSKHQAYNPSPPFYPQVMDHSGGMYDVPTMPSVSTRSSELEHPESSANRQPLRISPNYSYASSSSPEYPPSHNSPVNSLTRQPPSNPLHTDTQPQSLARQLSRKQSYGNKRKISAKSTNVPVSVSGPIIKHSGRFDFKLADRERRGLADTETRHSVGDKQSWSHESETSEEQWPGSY